MSYLQVNSFSDTMRRIMAFDVILPDDVLPEMKKDNIHYERAAKTLFLLHGYSANCKAWLSGSSIEELAIKYNLAVIMPSGDNGFYVDGAAQQHGYGTYVGAELPVRVRQMFGLSSAREDTLIMGLSMGGFGAIRLGLKYPQTFGKIAAMSSALIIHNIKNQTDGYVDQMTDYAYYHAVFGDLNKLEASDKNPEQLIRNLQAEGAEIPDIYMTCGTEDFLLEENRQFRRFLKENQVPHVYKESPGVHDWAFWGKELEPALEWLLG